MDVALVATGNDNLYERHRDTVKRIADDYGIDPVLLAAVIEHEGSGRDRFASVLGPAWRTLERSRLGGDTVGIGQMKPDNAARLFGLSMTRHVGG